MTFEQGAIILVPFPFTDLSASKQRPALVLRSDRIGPDLVVCAITSQLTGPLAETEFRLSEPERTAGGLPKPSKLKLAKRFTIHPDLVRRRLGALPPATMGLVLERLRSLFVLE